MENIVNNKIAGHFTSLEKENVPREWGHLEYHKDQTREEPLYFILQLTHKERA